MSRSKYEKEQKEFVLDCGYMKELIKDKKTLYKGGNIAVRLVNNEGVIDKINFNDWCSYSAVLRYESKDFDCAYLLIRSKQSKARKVKEKIANIVMNNNAVFLTLTFTDKVLESTSAETRRRYVARYLKSTSAEYVGNIDFSPDINREHYHAVVCNRADLKAWKYGYAYAEQVRAHDRDLTRVSKYITKLTAHALKVNATRLIYSRL